MNDRGLESYKEGCIGERNVFTLISQAGFVDEGSTSLSLFLSFPSWMNDFAVEALLLILGLRYFRTHSHDSYFLLQWP